MTEELKKYLTWKFVVLVAFAIIAYFASMGVEMLKARVVDQDTINKSLTAANQAVCDRVMKLETNYDHIMGTLGKIERGQEKLADALDKHERYTRRN